MDWGKTYISKFEMTMPLKDNLAASGIDILKLNAFVHDRDETDSSQNGQCTNRVEKAGAVSKELTTFMNRPSIPKSIVQIDGYLTLQMTRLLSLRH